MGASNASAQLSVTALAGAPIYEPPMTGNAMDASRIRRGISVQDMTFAEANNYCVSNLLAEDYVEALRACEAALNKFDNEEVRLGGSDVGDANAHQFYGACCGGSGGARRSKGYQAVLCQAPRGRLHRAGG